MTAAQPDTLAPEQLKPLTLAPSIGSSIDVWCATLKLQRRDLWHLRRVACDLEVDGRLCSAAFVQVGEAK